MKRRVSKTVGASIVLLIALGCTGGEPSGNGEGCNTNADCAPGQVCIDGCHDVCVMNDDCSGGQVCFNGICSERVGDLPPRIDTVEGNGHEGPGYVRDRITILGAYFTDAAFTLESNTLVATLTLTSVSDTSVTAMLPTNIVADTYTLSVANQNGGDDVTVNLLADPATGAEVLALLVDVDGTGSGLDADLLDGQEASAFALQTDLANYAPVDAVSGDVTVTGDVVVGGEVTYTTPKQSYVQVLPAEFHPSGSGGTYTIGRNWVNGAYMSPAAGGTTHSYAIPRLPHGATITSFSCILDDSSDSGDAQVRFIRQAWEGGDQDDISVVNTGGANVANPVENTEFTGTLDTTMTLVDLDAYFYYLYGTFGGVASSTVMIRRCKIGFTYDSL